MASGAHAVICAGGGTSWEMTVLGARLGVIKLAENQGENYRALTEGGLAVGLGQLPNGLRQEAFRSLLFEGEGPGIARGQVPDGLGARRCAEQILAMLH